MSSPRCLRWILAVLMLAASVQFAQAAEPAKPIRAGIIGLDTSHVVAFAKLLRDPKKSDQMAGLTIVAAYPGGNPKLPISWNRVEKFTKTLRDMGVEIVDSIDELLKRVDVVLLESVDGGQHLEQARQVIAAGKPLFIDKPLADSTVNAMRILRLAEAKKVPCFSASSLRFTPMNQAIRNHTSDFGDVVRCTAWSSAGLNPKKPEPFWFHGIHGVEILFTIMGPGCDTVSRPSLDRATAVWKDGRHGEFVAKEGYGGTVQGAKKTGDLEPFHDYGVLMADIIKFFKTGKPPVTANETLEIMAFMEAADESQRQGGAPVRIADVLKKAEDQIAREGL
ncbi:MAG: Gfo/Idh/MocA family oxidoreductase [Thermoguttaceae bacterium]